MTNCAIALPAHTNATIFRCGLYIVCTMMHQKLLSVPVFLANARCSFPIIDHGASLSMQQTQHLPLTLHRVPFNKNLVNQRVIAIIRHTHARKHTKFIIYNKMHFKVRAKANADNNYFLLLLLVRKRRRSK